MRTDRGMDQVIQKMKRLFSLNCSDIASLKKKSYNDIIKLLNRRINAAGRRIIISYTYYKHNDGEETYRMYEQDNIKKMERLRNWIEKRR